MRIKIISLSILILSGLWGFGQNDIDFNKAEYQNREKTGFTKYILPSSLILTGIALNFGETKYKINNSLPKTHTEIDDYIQYAPIPEIYFGDIIEKRSLNNVFQQSKNLFIAQATTAIIVHTLKNTIKMERPDGGMQSFPSGHTSQSFVSSTVLYNEFKNTNAVLAYSGYLFSGTTGVLRMTNEKHWAPDVLVAAGIGILVTQLVYKINPLKSWRPFKERKEIGLIPKLEMMEGNILMGFSMTM